MDKEHAAKQRAARRPFRGLDPLPAVVSYPPKSKRPTPPGAPANWPTTVEHTAWLRKRQRAHRICAAGDPVHRSFATFLRQQTGEHWTMQAAWGFRFFDFWCVRLGVAFNLLAPGANLALQEALDAFDLQRSGLVIWSIPRGDWTAAEEALLLLPAIPAWHRGHVVNPATLSCAETRPTAVPGHPAG